MKTFKIIGVVFAVIIVVFITAVIVLVAIVNSTLNKEKGDAEVVLQGYHSESKKAVVIFQPSFGGKTNIIANEIGRGLSKSGFQVTLNHPGKHLPSDLSEYDVVFFGSPIYAGQISGVLKEYMKEAVFSENPRIVVFATGLLSDNELDLMDDLPLQSILYDMVKFYATDTGFVEAFNYGNKFIY